MKWKLEALTGRSYSNNANVEQVYAEAAAVAGESGTGASPARQRGLFTRGWPAAPAAPEIAPSPEEPSPRPRTPREPRRTDPLRQQHKLHFIPAAITPLRFCRRRCSASTHRLHPYYQHFKAKRQYRKVASSERLERFQRNGEDV
ncbi:unnamed protein product [Leptosia nina]|uniref:Uncharacterized protein n=1 Tax=Leptosia nina TaxID=320188 RepID=A0AAV1JKJ9_9NEOP